MTIQENCRLVILVGTGQRGKQALDYYGAKNVFCFADKQMAGWYYFGIPVVSYDDLRKLQDEYQIVIAAEAHLKEAVRSELRRAGIKGAMLFDPEAACVTIAANPRLMPFRNINAGKRCFLIGNGPSLLAEDLEQIAQLGDISFASNKIYRIFGQTTWRPDYYFASDMHFISQNWEDIASLKGHRFLAAAYITPEIFISLNGDETVHLFQSRYLEYDSIKNALLPYYELYHEEYPTFSGDAARCVYEGFSVTFLMLQWAAYMGFTEMYLLGVDHNYKNTCNYFEQFANAQAAPMTPNGDYFCDNYAKKDELMNIADVHSTGLAYEKAEQYSRANGFRIFNATRGGNLEIFERVDFDQIMAETTKTVREGR